MPKSKPKKLVRAVEELRWDIWIAVVAIGLSVFGVVMVYSASSAAKAPHKFLISQTIWVALGLIGMTILRRIDYHRFAEPKLIFTFLGMCVILLLIVFLFPPINGAHRWLTFRSFSAQPSELAKVALIIFFAWFLSERDRHGELGDFWATIAPSTVVLGVLAALIIKEPDLGTTMMLCVIFVTMLFAAGVPLRHLIKLSPLILIALVILVVKVAWRLERVRIFLDPESDPLGKGYQILQSLIAVGSGGTHGLGFGQGRQKLSFLIAPQSDFIFAVIAEELGMVGAVTLVAAFGFFLWRGLRAARRAPDRLGELLATGLTTGIVFQAFFNISVALNLVPAKGITLPFVSAGGSSLIVALGSAGILLNISQQGRES